MKKRLRLILVPAALASVFCLVACADVLGVEDIVVTEGLAGPPCGFPSDCPTLPTTPIDCAVAECVDGKCLYKALDQDRDEHAARTCKSQDGTPVATGDDCDDNNPDLYPGHPAPCGEVDGRAIAYPGGAPIGACRYGTKSCNEDGTVAACVGATGPVPETTCTPDLDEDCNGSALDGCSCVAGETAACGPTDVGACQKGIATCGPDNKFGPCEGAIQPAPRNCGSADDFNCNGMPDEQEAECTCVGGSRPKTVRACNGHGALDGIGACKAGTQTCTANGAAAAWSACVGAVGPSAEKCDTVDRNCNKIQGINEFAAPAPAGATNCAVTYACLAPGRGPLYYRTGIGWTNFPGAGTVWTGYAPRGDLNSGAYPPGTYAISRDNSGTKMGPITKTTACCAGGCPSGNIFSDSNTEYFTP